MLPPAQWGMSWMSERRLWVTVACKKAEETKHENQMPLILLTKVCILFLVLVTAHTLTVETPAKELQVARGSNATLRCQFNTDTSVTSGDFVVWRKINSADDAVTRYFDGLVQYGKGYENRIRFTGNLESGDISITINEVTMEDNGTYACSVRLRNDPPRQSAVTSLFVLIAPSKPECKIVGTAEYGQTINLTCISHEGSPKPTYSWQSFNVQHEPRVLQTTKGEQITLKNISADTSGFYICTSTNIVGKESCNMTVSVVPPSMNIALYAGIIGGAVAAIVVIGIIAYCCCCRGDKNTDYEMTETKDADEFSQRNPTQNQRAKDDNEDE
ncbi:cell surface A33 antigen isoform X1 [Cygnus olor]|uniref:cell surface A33 antigen isoform X1 n=1 Tax=Cygnus olor TaxID=8869 RepID=UPI001ADE5682|nr:cell surface A33 antigen isoform X1 [Cygnus olor]